uniref:Uncharacterized protein n=1 Tax=Candidozyma auris TaxID=498019 RepID=A0A0L0P0A8_CANAR
MTWGNKWVGCCSTVQSIPVCECLKVVAAKTPFRVRVGVKEEKRGNDDGSKKVGQLKECFLA